mmetsp:Transcript_106797/g.275997  ORF Transcript_106797/g.275997 Transcript_106797/m.275997 type:complete len:358 (+) Transcript_106797:44-1117(+)
MAANCNLSNRANDEGVLVGEGEFRRVRLGRYTEGPRVGERCVHKVFKTGGVYEDTFFTDDIKASDKAVEIAGAFQKYLSAKATPFVVRVNKPEVWKYTSGQHVGQKVLVEPFIPNFKKFNSNTGKADNNYEVAQALSHFSYDYSLGQLVLCDLQGGMEGSRCTLSDVVLLSNARAFGTTDLGSKGIENFFHHHRCNKICSPSWKRCARPAPHYIPTMTTTMQLPMRPALPAVPCQTMWPAFPSPMIRRSSGPTYCNACDRYHREGTVCPKQDVQSKNEWSWCFECQRDHKPGTECPKDKPKPSEDWEYCYECQRRHRPETRCPKASRERVSDDWVHCFDCDRRHRCWGNCPKRGRRY